MITRIASWLEPFFSRVGKGILQMNPGRMLGTGFHDTLPTAAQEFEGVLARTADGVWVCQPDGAGGWEWVLLGDAASFAYGTTYTDIARGDHTHDTLVWTVAEAELLAGTGGQFTIASSDLTPDAPVVVRQIPGDIPDELEFAQISAAGVVTAPNTITVYWTAPSVMTGPIRVAWQAI